MLDHPFFRLCVFVFVQISRVFLRNVVIRAGFAFASAEVCFFFAVCSNRVFGEAVFLKKVKARFLFLPGSTANS